MKKMRNVLLLLTPSNPRRLEGIALFARSRSWHLTIADHLTHSLDGWSGDGALVTLRDDAGMLSYVRRLRRRVSASLTSACLAPTSGCPASRATTRRSGAWPPSTSGRSGTKTRRGSRRDGDTSTNCAMRRSPRRWKATAKSGRGRSPRASPAPTTGTRSTMQGAASFGRVLLRRRRRLARRVRRHRRGAVGARRRGRAGRRRRHGDLREPGRADFLREARHPPHRLHGRGPSGPADERWRAAARADPRQAERHRRAGVHRHTGHLVGHRPHGA